MRKVRTRKTFGRKAKPNRLGFTEFEIAKLELKPGDILVLRTDQHLSLEQSGTLRTRIQELVGANVKVMVLGSGLSLAVIEDKRAA